MLNDLKRLIEIPSVLGEREENAPFGADCRKALDAFLEMARSYGLKTGEGEGYCGWAEYGEGEKMVAAACHLDVVPAGSGWTTPPFKLTVEGGKMYGRGVADDKAPAVACLHALKSLKDKGVVPPARLRLIVGLNEENGSACLAHYREHCEIPSFAFVPDSDFPVISSEKAILHLTFEITPDELFKDSFYDFHWGLRPNVVPAEAGVNVKPSFVFDELKAIKEKGLFANKDVYNEIIGSGFKDADFSIQILQNDIIRLDAAGRAGHAMSPQKADNAGWKIFRLLSALMPKSDTLKAVSHLLCTPLAAERLGIATIDETGSQTINLGLVKFSGGKLYLTLDLRCPASSDREHIKQSCLQKMRETLSENKADIKQNYYAPALSLKDDAPIIEKLLNVYNEVTGNEKFCLHIGGGTYARELPNAVAFGATFPGDECCIHDADENYPLDKFMLLPEIFAKAFLALAELE